MEGSHGEEGAKEESDKTKEVMESDRKERAKEGCGTIKEEKESSDVAVGAKEGSDTTKGEMERSEEKKEDANDICICTISKETSDEAEESFYSKQMSPVGGIVATESANAVSGSNAEEDIYFINPIDKSDESVGNVNCYEGDSESENSDSEASDYEYSESDIENVADNLTKRIQDVSDMDYFYKEYDCEEYIASSASILHLAINHSTVKRTFLRRGEQFPERISENQMEEYNQFSDDVSSLLCDGVTKYMDAVNIADDNMCDGRGISVALISTLKKPTVIKGGSMCLCYWPGGDGFDRIRKACRTTFYNHLVFDFLASELVIQKGKDYDCKDYKCHFQEYFDSFIKEELSSDEVVSSYDYCIDIKSIIENNEGFNHASCNCHIPAFKITEYFNLKSYPSLDHIHVVGGEKNGHVFVWTIYGGIVAL
eukprot:gene9267-10245_t